MSLACQEDEMMHEKTLAELRVAGFMVEGDRLVPPQGAKSSEVIAAISAAFQRAKRRN